MESKKKSEIKANEAVIQANIDEENPVKAIVCGTLPLNIREGRTIESASLGLLPPGTEINVLKVGKEWCKIDGGYVMKKFLTLS